MDYNNKQLKTVSVPQRVFESFIDAYQRMEKFSDEFEDFILVHNKKFISKVKKARKEHLGRKLRGLKLLKQELK